jgi:hypothetical protein
MGTINHVKQLQKRVKELEQQNKRGKEPMIILHNELLPYVKAKVLDKNILFYITCEKQNGIELKILEMLENLHLFVISTSVLPFGSSTLGITIIAKVRTHHQISMLYSTFNLMKTSYIQMRQVL